MQLTPHLLCDLLVAFIRIGYPIIWLLWRFQSAACHSVVNTSLTHVSGRRLCRRRYWSVRRRTVSRYGIQPVKKRSARFSHLSPHALTNESADCWSDSPVIDTSIVIPSTAYHYTHVLLYAFKLITCCKHSVQVQNLCNLH